MKIGWIFHTIFRHEFVYSFLLINVLMEKRMIGVATRIAPSKNKTIATKREPKKTVCSFR